MDNINILQNHPSFTSNVQILNGVKHSTRFKKIAPIIEEKTAKIKDYTIYISKNHDNRGGIQLDFFARDGECEHTAVVTQNYLKALMEKSDKTIAEKIAKLQRIFVKRDKTIDEGNKFFNKIMKNDKYNDPANFEEKFYDALVDKCFADQKEAVQRDNILKNFDVWG